MRAMSVLLGTSQDQGISSQQAAGSGKKKRKKKKESLDLGPMFL